MILCPIARHKASRPNALAIDRLTYAELDHLVSTLCEEIAPHGDLIQYQPKGEVRDVALLFAAWRLGKTVFPLNRRPDSRTPPCSDAATLIETSSGSKIVCHPLEAHTISAVEAIKALSITEESHVLLNLPLYHVSGIATAMRTFMAGAHLTFSIEEATHISMVPTQLYRLVKHSAQLPRCQSILLGGAPCSESLLKQAQYLPINTSYGMTETASMVIYNKKPLPHIEVQIRDDGELLLKGPTLFTHYIGDQPREEWFATKDIARKTPSGEIEILGRKDRQFISGGENIQPEEVEKVLVTLQHINGARLIPKPDPEYGMKSTALVYTDRPLSEERLKSALKEILPRHLVPKEFTVKVGEAPAKIPLE